MNKDVIISVKGNQSALNQEKNMLEMITGGKYYKKDNTYYVTYKESEVTGMKGTTTTLKIHKNGIVTLMRFGPVNSQLVFEKGQKHISYYNTPHGSFTIGIFANNVNIDVDDCGGEIHIGYNIEIDNNNSGDNDFHMSIKETKH